jgi:hypothetical protein
VIFAVYAFASMSQKAGKVEIVATQARIARIETIGVKSIPKIKCHKANILFCTGCNADIPAPLSLSAALACLVKRLIAPSAALYHQDI